MFYKFTSELFSHSALDAAEKQNADNIIPLTHLKIGDKAQVVRVSEDHLLCTTPLPQGELERRLLEMGFVEGTEVSLQHEGFFKKDPIAVLIRSCSLVAIRRKEAEAILVRKMF